jgi:hypothetical protein
MDILMILLWAGLLAVSLGLVWALDRLERPS